MRGTEFFKEMISQPPFSRMYPQVAAFFKDYLRREKVAKFNGRYVVNTHFPPYPSPAFDTMAEQFNAIGEKAERSLFSVTLAVTNRCTYRCWHCYNAGRSQQDLSLAVLLETIRQLLSLNAVSVTLTGGEPLLRPDLEEVVRAFDGRAHLVLNTTGRGLTPTRARVLKEAGLFALGVSLDSENPAEHDRLRGHEGAFVTAINALETAANAGLYPYIITVGTHDLLQRERFESFLQFAAQSGALEVHLLEPCATGRLAGRSDVLLTPDEYRRMLDFQREVAKREDLPILSTFLYLESPEAFGCGAGLTHLYIDGSGEVCPCNLVPLSFGNVIEEPLSRILDRMGEHFRRPGIECAGRSLSPYISEGELPLPPGASAVLCEKYLPKYQEMPRFFRIRREAQSDVGAEELKTAYNRVSGDYDEFWLAEATRPVAELVDKVNFRKGQRVFEAGCGTGCATVLIAPRAGTTGEICAADLSEGMIAEARARASTQGLDNIRFVTGDALELLASAKEFDVVFSSWVLGYIPVPPFFKHSYSALKPGGRLAFVVHKDHSPREALDIFYELVAEDPSVLEKRVAFDFPRDIQQVSRELQAAGFAVEHLWEGRVVFSYDTPELVLEHLLKSGAGTAFYDAVISERRSEMKLRFVEMLAARNKSRGSYRVIHKYFSCVARKC
jgi:MoaA/NifB/PqqE/SkfB family radical SAM enzyme/ubiquinone/menaquinone biosynthesis C-methylase UbiE